jgi:hypothetical protein
MVHLRQTFLSHAQQDIERMIATEGRFPASRHNETLRISERGTVKNPR